MSNRETIARFLHYVKEPGELAELRTDQGEGKAKRRYSGYYNDPGQLARDAEDWGGNCYITVNRLDPSIPATNCLARCRKGACTKAENISRRTLLYVDLDPVRPAGVPSTDTQHQAAIDLGKFIRDQLGWSMLLGDSGNGACLFGKIDLSPESTLPKRVLKTIKVKWETPAVAIDLVVASLARICRLLGTNNYKGGKCGREATIIDAPTRTVTEVVYPPSGVPGEGTQLTRVEDLSLEVITEAQLEAFAPLPKKQAEKARIQQLVTSWKFGKTEEEQIANVKALLDAKGIPYTIERNPDSRGTPCTWFRFAECIFRPGHCDGRTWIKVHPIEGVSGGCFHAKCAGRGLVHILQAIAPELAAQAAEVFDDSHRLGRSYLQANPPLVIWQRVPYLYRDGAYSEDSEGSVKAELNLHVKREFDALGFKETPNVTTGLVYNVYAAVEAIAFDRAEDAPHWRTNGHKPVGEYLAFRNGLVHVPSYLEGRDYWLDHTPDYFSLGTLPYDFNPKAPTPANFIAYCQYQWADANVHLFLEEIVGDVLMADPRQRVYYPFVGKAFAGKSALTEAIEHLVGERNRCAVDLTNFASQFGLEAAIGKKLILVSEAGVDVRHAQAITDKIKRITGNDLIEITRKHKPAISTRLNAKIVAVSNNLLRLVDNSGALFDRTTPLLFTRRIEDPDKTFPEKLKAEASGIVLLALKGWKRLRDNGKFTWPESSKQVLEELRESGSPVLTFVAERCHLDQEAFTPTEDLFKEWARFCHGSDLKPGDTSEFIIALKSVLPDLRRRRKTVGDARRQGYDGIKIKAGA